MTNKAEVCGWQPKGSSEDIPKPPKFNTDNLSVEKLQERCDRYEKALTEMRNAFGGATFIDSKNKLHSVSEYVSDVLAAIGGDDE
ncbi:MAG: hypothetical protein ACRCZN_10080 [Lactococcus lactis]